MTTTVHKNLVMLARMLDRLDRSARPVDAHQYRALVAQLTHELRTVPHDAGLQAVLASFPSTAELYENLHYAHAGLCRSPLEAAMAAEVTARQAIAAARRAGAQPGQGS